MFSYYDTEFQPELKQAEVERCLARSVLVHEAVKGARPPVRERMAAALVALAQRIAPAAHELPAQETPLASATRS